MITADDQQHVSAAVSHQTVSHTHTDHQKLSLPPSLHFNKPFTRTTWIIRYQKVSIPDFTGAKDDEGGGDKWSYKMCKAPVKSLPPTNQHPTFYRLDALPVAQPIVLKDWIEKNSLITNIIDCILINNLYYYSNNTEFHLFSVFCSHHDSEGKGHQSLLCWLSDASTTQQWRDAYITLIKTDAAKRKGGGQVLTTKPKQSTLVNI